MRVTASAHGDSSDDGMSRCISVPLGLRRAGAPAGVRRLRPESGAARARTHDRADGARREGRRLDRRGDVDPSAGHDRHALRRRPRPSALAPRPAQRRRARRRDERAAAARRWEGYQGLAHGPVHETKRRQDAEREPHHALSRREWRRRRRGPLGLPGEPHLAVRDGPRRRRALRRQHGPSWCRCRAVRSTITGRRT
jgi:hypothetical protein